MDMLDGLPERWTLTLDAPNLLRVTFGADKCGTVEVPEALRGVRLVLRDYAPGFAVTESGRPVDAGEERVWRSRLDAARAAVPEWR